MPHNRIILMTPGPTMVDYEILLELAKPTINHASTEFDEIHTRVLEKLKKVFGTSGRTILIPGSGTSAMDFALRSILKENSTTLVLKTGYFGDYLARGIRLLGSKTIIVESELGYGFTSKDLDRLLEKNKEIEAIALQHVDTSTSVANPVKELARVAKEWGLRILVDGVAAIGGMEMKMDEWGVDVCFTGSQKALGVPPGLGIIAYSKSFSEELDSEEKPISLFFNIKALLKEMESTKNYYLTPAVNLVYALDKATDLIEEEGLEKRYERHKIMAETVRAAIKELDLKLVAKEGFYADTVTAVYLPERVEWPQLYNTMRYSGVEIAGGLGDLKGKIFRIGHMGQVGYNEILTTIAALERSLLKLGYRVRLGEALTVIQERYLRAGI